jgi:hypothetical protein
MTANHQLAAVVAESGITRKRLARLVREACASLGAPSSADHVAVARWLAGVTPRPDTARALAVVLSRELGRPVALADIGLAHTAPAVPAPRPDAASVASVRQAWQARRAEIERRAAELAAELAYLDAVLAVPVPAGVGA